MTRVLVLYGTTDGHTRKVAQRLADTIRTYNIDVDVANADVDEVVPHGYAGVIVAASLHAGGYQPAVLRWTTRHADTLATKTTAFVTVCLGILQHEPAVQRELDRLRSAFLQTAGWQPTVTKNVAGALLYRNYNWLKRLAMVRIVRKAGGDTDTSRNYEYTDWKDVEAFAAEFAGRVGAAAGQADPAA